jgi:hypothetical protein
MSPLELVCGSKVRVNTLEQHPFGCPAYVLDGDLQNGKKIPKWSSRSRVGIYLGYSPQHARSVGLILSTTTGLVSPQFHVRYDDEFETTKNGIIDCHWQVKCWFEQKSPDIQREIIEGSDLNKLPPNIEHIEQNDEEKQDEDL